MTGGTSRTLPILSDGCNLPSSAEAYSLNLSAIPPGPLAYLTAYPNGQSQPQTATLNDNTGTIVANAAIVQAGTSGSINVFASNNTDLVIDIDGYFAAPGTGGLSLYTLTPCRALDTRPNAFSGTLNVNIGGSGCAPSASAYVMNATVVPPGALGYLTLWAQGAPQAHRSGAECRRRSRHQQHGACAGEQRTDQRLRQQRY